MYQYVLFSPTRYQLLHMRRDCLELKLCTLQLTTYLLWERSSLQMGKLPTPAENNLDKVPTFAYEKRLSRIETLRLAITYISFMGELISTNGDAATSENNEIFERRDQCRATAFEQFSCCSRSRSCLKAPTFSIYKFNCLASWSWSL